MPIRVQDLSSTKSFTLGSDSGYFPVATTVTGRDVVIVFRAGAGHMGITGRLEAVRSEDGNSWGEPVLVAASEWDDRNPAVGVTGGGTIIVAYHGNGCYTGPGQYEPKLGRFRTRLTRSRDGGRTWERPFPLNLEEFDGLSPYGQTLTLPDGTMLMPIYGNRDWKKGSTGLVSSFLLRSGDEGLTWTLHGRVGDRINESAFLPSPGGGMVGVVRSDEDEHLLATFADGGGNWTRPADLTAGHEHPACLTRLGDGSILLSHGCRQRPFGARGLISRDDGRSWLKDRTIIFSDSADNWDCGYPSTVRLCDGRLVTAWYSTAGAGDAWSCAGARCHVLVYREAELPSALGSTK